MSAEIRFRPAAEADIPLLRSLAERIWRAWFPGLISNGQIDYMLEWMYSPATLAREIREGVIWELAFMGDEPAGYLSCSLEAAASRLELRKVYLLPELHGRGLGQRMIERAKEAARGAGARSIFLRVNRGNARAVRAYERAGFRVAETSVRDIGRGFVMDDFVMVLDPVPPGA